MFGSSRSSDITGDGPTVQEEVNNIDLRNQKEVFTNADEEEQGPTSDPEDIQDVFENLEQFTNAGEEEQGPTSDLEDIQDVFENLEQFNDEDAIGPCVGHVTTSSTTMVKYDFEQVDVGESAETTALCVN